MNILNYFLFTLIFYASSSLNLYLLFTVQRYAKYKHDVQKVSIFIQKCHFY